MHVVLVGAEFEENLAVRYLRGALEHAGHRVTTVVFNEPADSERAAREIAESGAPLAGLSMVFTYRAREFARLAERTRELGFSGHVIAGGHFAAMHAAELLSDVPALDSVAIGEGELILCQLAESLADPSHVSGLVWRNGEHIQQNADAVKPPDLDVLPFPPRKQPFDDYLGIPITNILSSRGCSRSCAFCSIAAWHKLCGGERLRLRSPEQVAEEMAELHRRGVRVFNFHDDNFVLDDKAAMHRRLDELDAALRARGVTSPIAFAIKCRPDTVDVELFERLRAMGMFRIFLGVEAGTPESLRRLGRGQTVEDNVRALQIVSQLDIHTCFNLLLLNPDSTLEDMADNVAFLRQHPHHAMNFCRTEVYSGTPLERWLRRQDRLLGDYWGYDYQISDPRAQTAFEIMYPAFEARNYGDEGLHHLTMQIDYEQQLLQRFFGPHEALRRRVKQQIVKVNLNTCDHLDRLIAGVDALADPSDAALLLEEIKAGVVRDNERLGREVKALLDEIRTAPFQPTRGKKASGWVQAAASAGLVASVTLASAGCKEKSHPTEMVAIPTATASGPPPKPVDAQVIPPLGPEGLVKPALGEKLLSILKEWIPSAYSIEIELWFDADRRVEKAILHSPKVDGATKMKIENAVRKLELSEQDPDVRGQRFIVHFSSDEIMPPTPNASAPKPTPTTHMKERVPRPEMAPRPPPPRPEMAPRPPKPGGNSGSGI